MQAAVSTILRAPDGKKVAIAKLADENGMTALHWTVQNRNAAGIRWLMDKRPDLEAKDDRGRTPLKIALDNTDVRAMTMLIDGGAMTTASVERDIQARGGSPPSFPSGGHGKYRMSATSGNYQDAGTDVMAVNYDFDAAGPAGRLVAVTIVNHANTGPGYEKLLASRTAAAAAITGPLEQKSATELVASGRGCQLRLLPNADTWFIYEVYQLPN